MKKLYSLLLAMLCSVAVFSQDIITKKNGDDIQAQVLEIGLTDVKYKRFDNQTGPTYTILKKDILMIRYKNGSKDIFSDEESKEPSKPVEPTTQSYTKPVEQNQSYSKPAEPAIPTYELTGRWKNDNGVIFTIGRDESGYYLLTENSTVKERIRPVLDAMYNPIPNRYKYSIYEFSFLNNDQIDVQYYSSHNTYWNRYYGANPATTQEEITTTQEEESTVFRTHELGALVISLDDPVYTFGCFAESSIDKSDVGIGIDLLFTGYDIEVPGAEVSAFTSLIGIRSSYHAPIPDIVDLYAGMKLFYNFGYINTYYDYDLGLEDSEVEISEIGWDWHLGSAVWLGESVSLNIEYMGRSEFLLWGIGIDF